MLDCKQAAALQVTGEAKVFSLVHVPKFLPLLDPLELSMASPFAVRGPKKNQLILVHLSEINGQLGLTNLAGDGPCLASIQVR